MNSKYKFFSTTTTATVNCGAGSGSGRRIEKLPTDYDKKRERESNCSIGGRLEKKHTGILGICTGCAVKICHASISTCAKPGFPLPPQNSFSS